MESSWACVTVAFPVSCATSAVSVLFCSCRFSFSVFRAMLSLCFWALYSCRFAMYSWALLYCSWLLASC